MREKDGTYQWHGRTVIGSDGEKVGKLEQIYEDPATGNPEWATVSSGLLQKTTHFLPLAGAQREGEDVQVAVTRDQVKDSPGFADDDELSESEERLLFEHYGVRYPDDAEARDRDDRDGDRATGVEPETTEDGPETRSQTGSADGGRRRLRRYVVTEVTTTVPVSDEETEIGPGRTDSTRS